MCGIAGFSLHPDDIGKVDASKLADAMLRDIVSRGRDATGAAWFDPEDGRCLVQKNDDPATRFVDYMSIPAGASTAIFHTRASTKGSPSLNENNHPIVCRDLVGVHNGVCRNDDALFDKVGTDKRTAQVDSEAIFAAINFGHWQIEGKPVIGDNLLDILGEIEGGAAIAWLEYATSNSLKLARISGSPLIVATSESGSFFFASTATAITAAARKADVKLNGDYSNNTHALPEGTYLQVVDGTMVSSHTFEPFTRDAGESWKTESKSGSSYTAGASSSGSSASKSTATTTKAAAKTDDADKGKGDSGKATGNAPSKPGAKSSPSSSEATSTADTDKDDDGTVAEFVVDSDGKVLSLESLLELDPDDSPPGAVEAAIIAIHHSLVEAVGNGGEDILGHNKFDLEVRFDAVNEYCEGLNTKDDAEFFETTGALGAWHEIGDWGYTDFLRNKEVPCQVVSMPETFPHGDYVLRCYMPSPDAKGKYETFLVTRTVDEFSLVSSIENPLVAVTQD